MTTLPEEAVTLWAVNIHGPDDLIAAPDYLSAVRMANAFNAWWMNLKTKQPHNDAIDARMWAVPTDWEGNDARGHADELSKPHPEYQWLRDTLSALEPSAARQLALEEAARNLIAVRYDTYKARNGKLCSIEGDDGEKAWIVPFDAMADLESALSSPDNADAGKVEGEGIERGKFYHHHWPMEKLLEARRDGLVDHSGGEAWRYEYSHKDEHGKYDILYRPVKNTTIPARLPSAPSSEGGSNV